jgi:hypothetical protein
LEREYISTWVVCTIGSPKNEYLNLRKEEHDAQVPVLAPGHFRKPLKIGTKKRPKSRIQKWSKKGPKVVKKSFKA